VNTGSSAIKLLGLEIIECEVDLVLSVVTSTTSVNTNAHLHQEQAVGYLVHVYYQLLQNLPLSKHTYQMQQMKLCLTNFIIKHKNTLKHVATTTSRRMMDNLCSESTS